MKLDFETKVRIIIYAAMAFAIISVALPAFASGDCKGQSCNNSGGGDVNVDTQVDTQVDVPINMQSNPSTSVNNESRSLGLSAGDVDINDYYRSYTVLYGFWQGTQSNPLAIAKDLAAEGRYEEAAILRCAPRTVRRAFGGTDACIERLSRPPVQAASSEPAVVHVEEDDDDDYRQEHEEELAQLRADLEAKLENLQQAQQRPVVRREVVEQRVGLTAEQKAKLREVKQ